MLFLENPRPHNSADEGLDEVSQDRYLQVIFEIWSLNYDKKHFQSSWRK